MYTQQNDLYPVIQQLQVMKEKLDALPVEPQVKTLIVEKIKDVEEPARQPNPDRKKVLDRLNEVLKTITVLAGSGEVIAKLEPFVKTAITWLEQALH